MGRLRSLQSTLLLIGWDVSLLYRLSCTKIWALFFVSNLLYGTSKKRFLDPKIYLNIFIFGPLQKINQLDFKEVWNNIGQWLKIIGFAYNH